jgi:hypothetical protein
VKPSIKRRDAGEMRILAISLIAQLTETLAGGLPGHTVPDIDAAIEHAIAQFIHGGKQPAAAVVQGVQHAKDRILHRNALMLCAVLMINFYIYR